MKMGGFDHNKQFYIVFLSCPATISGIQKDHWPCAATLVYSGMFKKTRPTTCYCYTETSFRGTFCYPHALTLYDELHYTNEYIHINFISICSLPGPVLLPGLQSISQMLSTPRLMVVSDHFCQKSLIS